MADSRGPRTAMGEAMRRLARTDLTRAELESALADKFATEEIAAALDQLESKGWLSDARVIARDTERAALNRHQGRLRLAQRLVRRGLETEDALAAAQSLDEESEVSKATRLLQGKAYEATEWSKAAGFLARRGFDEETIRSALAAVFPTYEG